MFGHIARIVVSVSDEEGESQEVKARNPLILQDNYKLQTSTGAMRGTLLLKLLIM
jgi:hypothetical protein